MARTGIALGSNLGNRLKNLQDARDLLRRVASDGECLQSPVYQTEPVHCPPGSPDFYNTVIEIEYAGTPHALLDATQAIEFRLGRQASNERNAPRVIDLDLLYFGDEVLSGDILDIPHPRLLFRRFVLQPLADLRPDLVLPGDDARISEHLRHLDSSEPPLALVQSVW